MLCSLWGRLWLTKMEEKISSDDGQQEAAATITGNDNVSSNIINNQKVKVHLVAVGSAPILKKNRFLMNRLDNFGVAISFLRKKLKLSLTSTASSSLFLYVNSAFVPSPTEQIGDLYDCFGITRGELVIHYSLQEAWGWAKCTCVVTKNEREWDDIKWTENRSTIGVCVGP